MTLELLYLPGCPNRGIAASLVRSVLKTEGLSAELNEIPVIIASCPSGAQWEGSLPRPELLNGTVVRAVPELEAKLSQQ